jgi:hypothetical protein
MRDLKEKKMSYSIDERLEKVKIPEEEIPNLLDNFRQILNNWSFSLNKNDSVGLYHLVEMTKYFNKLTGLKFKPYILEERGIDI